MRTYSRLLLINLIGVVCILGGSGALVYQCVQFERTWSHLREDVQGKAQAMDQVRGAIGYGGMIHAFKNYVLRREPQYITLFEQQTRLARQGIETYRSHKDLSTREIEDLALIEDMIDRYSHAMTQSIDSGEDALTLDDVVRIDDGPYLAAIDRMVMGLNQERGAIMGSVNKGLRMAIASGAWAGLLGSVLVLGVGGALAVRVGRRLDESIEERSRVIEQRSHFLANMSHEIRTPLSAVLGFAQLARDRWITPEEREAHLERIQCNGVHLMGLINNILDMSKLEAGQVELAPTTVNIRRLFQEVASIAGVRAHEKGIDLRVEFDDGVPESLIIDPMRVRQILVNLVGNSTKFTEHGSVTVRAEYVPAGPKSGELRVCVTDTGVGIEAEDLDRIFETFTQGDPTTTRRFGGTGLGLNISLRLAHLMGGDIDVRSKLGQGSVFTLRVPTSVAVCTPEVGQQEFTELKAEGRGALDGMRVLLVEDGPDNQVLLEKFLQLGGAAVTIVSDGQQAIDTIRESGAFDLVLMDMQMPNVDGYEATKRLRDSGYTAPIVALTAHAMSEDRERCTRVGCDGYLSKPIGRKQLISACLGYAIGRAA